MEATSPLPSLGISTLSRALSSSSPVVSSRYALSPCMVEQFENVLMGVPWFDALREGRALNRVNSPVSLLVSLWEVARLRGPDGATG